MLVRSLIEIDQSDRETCTPGQIAYNRNTECRCTR